MESLKKVLLIFQGQFRMPLWLPEKATVYHFLTSHLYWFDFLLEAQGIPTGFHSYWTRL